jgi:DNA polymerase III subunit chi
MATEVEFHTGVQDVPGFAWRLLRKAYRQGAQLLVTAPEPALSELDRRLWTQEALDFLPHVRLPAAPALTQRSPIWLATAWAAAPADVAARRVCLNLGADMPQSPAGLARIIEVVGSEPEAAQAGRERWRRYKALGLAVVHHNAA